MKSRMMVRSFSMGVLLSCAIASASFGFQGQDDQGPSLYAKTRSEVQAKMREGNLEEAIQAIDLAQKQEPESMQVASLRQLIATALLQKGNQNAAVEQMQLLIDFAVDHIDRPEATMSLPGQLNLAKSIFSRAGKPELADAVQQKVWSCIESKVSFDKPQSLHRLRSQILANQARELIGENKEAEAMQILGEDMGRAEQLLAKYPESEDALNYLMETFKNEISSSSATLAAFEKVEKFLASRIQTHPEDRMARQSFVDIALMAARLVARKEPDLASEFLGKARKVATEITDESFKPMMANYERMFAQVDGTIASAKKLLELVGKPAPAFDAIAWANGPERDPNGFKGKVVLLDFWAVWCGPCIATFPHLIHLQETYGSQGLQVLGVTRQYGFAWNEETKKAFKENDREVDQAEELAMLNQFMASHDLKHPTMLTPKESSMYSQFGVTGIPHAVVIDKGGLVRLIRVGSGEENAKEIEAMIVQLLAE